MIAVIAALWGKSRLTGRVSFNPGMMGASWWSRAGARSPLAISLRYDYGMSIPDIIAQLSLKKRIAYYWFCNNTHGNKCNNSPSVQLMEQEAGRLGTTSNNNVTGMQKLSDYGLTKIESSRAQELAEAL